VLPNGVVCEVGKYGFQDRFGIICTDCGFPEVQASSDELGWTSCKCRMGYRNVTTTASVQPPCQVCPIGYYKDTVGDTDCHACRANATTLTNGANSSSLCICQVGYYSLIHGGDIPFASSPPFCRES
jgi:hypothetical protein